MLKNTPFRNDRFNDLLNHALVQGNLLTYTDGRVFKSYPVEYNGTPLLVPNKIIKTALKLSKTIEFTAEGVVSGEVFFKISPSEESHVTVENFPRPPHIPKSVTLTVPGFSEAVKKAGYAAAEKDVRYYLNGFLFEVQDLRMRVVTTDGHRLQIEELGQAPEGTPDIHTIFPRECIKLIDSDELTIGRNNAKVGEHLAVELIDGKFPQYERVIPKELYEVKFGGDKLLKFCNTIKKMKVHKLSSVQLQVDKGSKTLTASFTGADTSLQSETELDGPADHEMGLAINVQYLTDALKRHKDEVTMGYRCGTTAVVLNGNTIVMPVRQ